MKLEKLRKQIDEIDNRLLFLLEERFRLAKEVKKIKINNSLAIEDKNRELQILNRLKIKAASLNISQKFISKIFQQILAESKKIQRKK